MYRLHCVGAVERKKILKHIRKTKIIYLRTFVVAGGGQSKHQDRTARTGGQTRLKTVIGTLR